jgi:HPt (histidine-containing phosphotransfer) domain-containing protein
MIIAENKSPKKQVVNRLRLSIAPMAYEPGAIEAALAAAVGDDPSLMADLHHALVESAEHHADLLARARCDANWHTAAWRLKGLAASFGAMQLLAAAEAAIEAAPGDPAALRAVQRAIRQLAG